MKLLKAIAFLLQNTLRNIWRHLTHLKHTSILHILTWDPQNSIIAYVHPRIMIESFNPICSDPIMLCNERASFLKASAWLLQITLLRPSLLKAPAWLLQITLLRPSLLKAPAWLLQITLLRPSLQKAPAWLLQSTLLRTSLLKAPAWLLQITLLRHTEKLNALSLIQSVTGMVYIIRHYFVASLEVMLLKDSCSSILLHCCALN